MEQMDAARALATAPSDEVGRGAQLLLFTHAPEAIDHHPGQGLTLHSRHGEQLLDLAERGAAGEEARWAGVNVEVAPGHYRLRAGGGLSGASELMLTVVAGHHTQVLIPRRPISRGGGPWLQGVQVYLADMGQGFTPDRPDVELTARVTAFLADPPGPDWKLVSEVFQASQQSPLLALYGAHVLLEALRLEGPKRAPDVVALLEVALVRCVERLGPIPDVLAAILGMRWLSALDPDALELIEKASALANPAELHVWEKPEGWIAPPMLHSSWRFVVDSSIQSPRLVRSGSLLDQLAEAVLQEGPYLAWRISERPARVELVDETASGTNAAKEALAEELRRFAGDAQIVAELESRLQLSRLERRLLSHLATQPAETLTPALALADEPLIRALVVPWVTAQRTVGGLLKKLSAARRDTTAPQAVNPGQPAATSDSLDTGPQDIPDLDELTPPVEG